MPNLADPSKITFPEEICQWNKPYSSSELILQLNLVWTLNLILFRCSVKKVLGSTAFCIDENSGRLFSRMCYLYYPPQVNEDENSVMLSQQL